MTSLRPLSEALAELADSALMSAKDGMANASLRVTSVELSVPLDIRLSELDGALLGDLPRFRRRTAFDPEPARLSIILGEAPK